MFEDRTFENVLRDMLTAVPSEVDKREGSVLYDALAPAAMQLAGAYAELDRLYRLSHAQTSSGEALRLRGEDFGIQPQPASAAVRRGVFSGENGVPFEVEIGSRFAVGGLIFAVQEKVDAGVFKLICETAGAAGNIPSGAMLPLDYVDGLASATMDEVIVPGEDEETDEAYRARFFAQVRTPPTSGNRSAYRKWALEVQGVGDAYVLPAWAGSNTVKVSVIGTDRLPAGPGIVEAVKDYIDPRTGLGEGMGEGAAPAGAVVTVVAADAVPVDVTATITLNGSRTLEQVVADFGAALRGHLAAVADDAFARYDADRSIKFARIGTLLLDTPGVADYAAGSLLVNGAQANVLVPPGAVAVKRTVTLNE